ncbi:MAG: 30S ribosomal protein S8 [Candidatus Aminicenantia bacterium]
MTMTDPIADMLTRIRNAIMVKKREMVVPSSRLKLEIAKILKEEGFIENFKFEDDGKQGILKIYLKWTPDRQSVIRGLERVSKPGCRIYCTKDDLPLVMNGQGIAIISTSKGIFTDQKCREMGCGGEVLCYIW